MDEHGEGRPKWLSGYFLISDTELRDPNFFRTVVLLTEHNDEGAFGLVVNRLSSETLGTVLPDAGIEESTAFELPIYVGGPVQQEYLFLLHSGLPEHAKGEFASHPAEGVVFEPVTESAVSFIAHDLGSIPSQERPDIRIYGGYSGWGPGQLETELEVGAWIVHKATKEIVFHPEPEKSWADAMSRKGPLYRIIAQTGFRPSMN
jgi:putative transcriptional regulator